MGLHALIAVFPPDLWHGVTDSSGKITTLKTVPQLIANIIEIIITFASVAAVIVIIVAGIRFIISNGDPGKINAARDAIFNAILGLILASASYLIVDFIASRFQ